MSSPRCWNVQASGSPASCSMRGVRAGEACGVRDSPGALRVLDQWLAFGLDVVVGYSTTQYVGKVAIALAVADGRSGDTLVTRRYVGIKRRQADADTESAWREVMDAALARTMHDLATDPEVVAALGRV